MSLLGDALDWLISKVPAIENALKPAPNEPLDEPLGQLDVEKAAQDLEDRRRDRQSGVHK